MTIVPQSPDLFEGTMRENIDPVGEYQDAEIWEALNQVKPAILTLCGDCD
jgi:ABC-type multidrug transport system fused ATPase/permease subunit